MLTSSLHPHAHARTGTHTHVHHMHSHVPLNKNTRTLRFAHLVALVLPSIPRSVQLGPSWSSPGTDRPCLLPGWGGRQGTWEAMPGAASPALPLT